METLLWVAAVAAIVLGLAGVLLPLLPGMPLLFGGMLLAAWLDDFARVGIVTVVALGVLAALAWLIEYLGAAWGVKRVGASGLAVAGAAAGALLGLFAGLPGLILGPVLGAIAGEYLSGRNRGPAAKAGLAAGLGFIVAIVAKLAIAFTMLGVFALAYFV